MDTRTKLRVATWKVLTLRQLGAAELLIKELQRYQVTIAGICEARWTGSGETVVSNHSILWSGHETRGRGGVALVLSPPARRALIGWQPVGERMLKARFRHRFGKLSIIVAYAPTYEADANVISDMTTPFSKSLGPFILISLYPILHQHQKKILF